MVGFTDDGKMIYSDYNECLFDLLNDIGLSIDSQGFVYDQETKQRIEFSGRKLKASIDPNHPVYAGQGEVMLDLFNNVRLATVMLGYCMEKETAENGFNSVSHYIDDVKDTNLTSLSIKMADGSVLSSGFYRNKCLKYIDAMFLVYGDRVDLHNFDSEE